MKSNLEKDAEINELISELQGKEQAGLKTTMDFHKSAQLKEMSLYQQLKDMET